jgi:hypothetical protein
MSARSFEVRCTLDVVLTAEVLHAHLTLDGVNVGPGDSVQLLQAPGPLAPGTSMRRTGRARVRRAGALGRAWARLKGLWLITEMYDVSFTPGRAAAATLRRKP